MISKAKCLKIRSLAMTSATVMDDVEASTIPEMFPSLTGNGALISAGTRINWKGQLKKAAVDLWDTAENNPDNAPSIWVNIDYVNGYRAIPEFISATEAFSKGELGWWNGTVYESVHDGANVWNPEQFAAGWRKVG